MEETKSLTGEDIEVTKAPVSEADFTCYDSDPTDPVRYYYDFDPYDPVL